MVRQCSPKKVAPHRCWGKKEEGSQERCKDLTVTKLCQLGIKGKVQPRVKKTGIDGCLLGMGNSSHLLVGRPVGVGVLGLDRDIRLLSCGIRFGVRRSVFGNSDYALLFDLLTLVSSCVCGTTTSIESCVRHTDVGSKLLFQQAVLAGIAQVCDAFQRGSSMCVQPHDHFMSYGWNKRRPRHVRHSDREKASQAP